MILAVGCPLGGDRGRKVVKKDQGYQNGENIRCQSPSTAAAESPVILSTSAAAATDPSSLSTTAKEKWPPAKIKQPLLFQSTSLQEHQCFFKKKIIKLATPEKLPLWRIYCYRIGDKLWGDTIGSSGDPSAPDHSFARHSWTDEPSFNIILTSNNIQAHSSCTT
jgi:hypothetical protein